MKCSLDYQIDFFAANIGIIIVNSKFLLGKLFMCQKMRTFAARFFSFVLCSDTQTSLLI